MIILPTKTFQRIPIRLRNSTLFKLNTAHSLTVTLFPKGEFITSAPSPKPKAALPRDLFGESRSSLILIPAATCKRKLCPLSKGHDGRSRRLENEQLVRPISWSMEMDGFTTESTVIFICLRTGKTAFGLTVRNAGGFGRPRTCIHTSISQIKVPGYTCWESPTVKASFSITGRIRSSFN